MMDEQSREPQEHTTGLSRSSAVPGVAAIGLVITGIAGLLSGEGSGLLAAALAFGVIFYVSFD